MPLNLFLGYDKEILLIFKKNARQGFKLSKSILFIYNHLKQK